MDHNSNLERVRFLEGERIFLTPRADQDFDACYRWMHDRELVFLDDEYFRPRSIQPAKEEFGRLHRADDVMALSIIHKDDGKLIGLLFLFNIDYYERKCHWGMILEKPYRRQGIGAEIALVVMKYAFEDLGIRRLKSYTHSGNPGSVKFQERLGFVRESTLREEYFFGNQYYDRIDYALLKKEYDRLYAGNTERQNHE